MFERQIRFYCLKILTVQWYLLPPQPLRKMDAVSSSTTSELSLNHTWAFLRKLWFLYRTSRVTERKVNVILGSLGSWMTTSRREPELVVLIGRERSEGTWVKIKVGKWILIQEAAYRWQVFQRIFMMMSLWDLWGTAEFSLAFGTTVRSIYLWYICLLFFVICCANE